MSTSLPMVEMLAKCRNESSGGLRADAQTTCRIFRAIDGDAVAVDTYAGRNVSDEDARRIVNVQAPAADARAIVGIPKISVTMPTDWMLRGFELSLDRLRAASATERSNARELCIALFEMSNWLTSLTQRLPTLDSSPHVKAVLFVRNRTHHQFAAALYFDAADEAWKWYRLDVLPEPDDPEYRNERGERAYTQVAASRPLLHVLDKIQVAIGRLTLDA